MDQTNPAQVEGAPVDEAFRGARRYFRIGQIVPSSNTTMETEIPAMLRAREGIAPERFTFHSARMRMQHVTKEELAAMDRDSDRCALELSDAPVDVIGLSYPGDALLPLRPCGRATRLTRRLRTRMPESAGPAFLTSAQPTLGASAVVGQRHCPEPLSLLRGAIMRRGVPVAS